MTRTSLLALAGATLALSAVATSAQAYPGKIYSDYAALSIQQAQLIALDARHGQVLSGGLEESPLGSGYAYVFGIKTNGTLYHVDVDADTGNVLSNAKVVPNDDLGSGSGLFLPTPYDVTSPLV
jgi:hypothetical protein